MILDCFCYNVKKKTIDDKGVLKWYDNILKF